MDVIVKFSQEPECNISLLLLIVNDKNLFSISNVVLQGNRFLSGSYSRPFHREVEFEHGSLLAAFDVLVSLMVLECIPDHRQPETTATSSHLLLGIKRLEYPFQVLRSNPRTIVRDAEHGIFARANLLITSERLIQIPVHG